MLTNDEIKDRIAILRRTLHSDHPNDKTAGGEALLDLLQNFLLNVADVAHHARRASNP